VSTDVFIRNSVAKIRFSFKKILCVHVLILFYFRSILHVIHISVVLVFYAKLGQMLENENIKSLC